MTSKEYLERYHVAMGPLYMQTPAEAVHKAAWGAELRQAYLLMRDLEDKEAQRVSEEATAKAEVEHCPEVPDTVQLFHLADGQIGISDTGVLYLRDTGQIYGSWFWGGRPREWAPVRFSSDAHDLSFMVARARESDVYPQALEAAQKIFEARDEG